LDGTINATQQAGTGSIQNVFTASFQNGALSTWPSGANQCNGFTSGVKGACIGYDGYGGCDSWEGTVVSGIYNYVHSYWINSGYTYCDATRAIRCMFTW